MLDAKTETFLQVVEQQSYTEAARVLHLTQPAVSQHIQKLEAFYGCRLIDSSGHGVRLTAAGELLYRYLLPQRANQAQLMQMMSRRALALEIGATLSIADFYLPDALVRALLDGKTPIRMHVGNTRRILSLLGRGELDCALVEGPYTETRFETKVFRRAPFRVVAAANHPLAGRTVTVTELCAYPLVTREVQSGTRELMSIFLQRHALQTASFARVLEIGSFRLIKQLLRRSEGISILYEGVAAEETARGELCYLALHEELPTYPLHFLYRKDSPRKQEYEAFYENCMEKDR